MADGTPDISAVLAPWLQSDPWNPANYGGRGAMGVDLLASAATPSPYRIPFMASLGRAMQQGQQQALQTAQARMGLAGNAIGIQQQLAMMPFIMQRLARMAGGGATTSYPAQGASARTASSGYASPAPPPLLARPDDTTGSSPDQSADASPATPSGSAAPAAPRAPWMDAIDDAQFAGMLSLARGNPQGVLDASKLALEYNPSVATGMGVAKDPLTIDNAMVFDALRRGDLRGAQAAYFKGLQDSHQVTVDRYGNVTTLGGISPSSLGVNTFLPAQGMQTSGGVASPIPGILPTRQALAGAEALGKAQGELTEVVDPRTHQSYFVPKSALLSGGAPGAAASPAASPGSSPGAVPAGGAPVAGLSPGQKGFLEERGRESGKYVTQLQEAADSATNTNYALDQMVASARTARLGPGAPAIQFIENGLTALGQPFGVKPPQELSSYEQIEKYGNQIAFAATRQMGSREAAQIVKLQLESNPNKALVPDAFTSLVQSMRAMNSYIIAKNTAIQAQSGADNDTALQAASAWTQRIDPRVWDLSLGPQLAAKFAGTIGVPKIATAIPVMASEDAVAVMRNLPVSMRSQVLARLPVQAKQEILAAMQQGGAVLPPQTGGATGSF